MLGFILKPLKKRFGADREYYIMLDEIFGIYPNNIELYKLALVHRSASILMEDGTPINNERLEFLGDAILESIVSDYLFVEYPKSNEGFLTKMRSNIVNRTTLNKLCFDLGLSDYIISSQGIGTMHKHIFGNAVEAMIGAIYLDKGYEFVNRLMINRILPQYVDVNTMTDDHDYKSRLIEWCQKSRRTIKYATLNSEESTARQPMFTSNIFIENTEMGFGEGMSKKEAEQNASFNVLSVLTDDEAGDHLLEIWDRTEQDRSN